MSDTLDVLEAQAAQLSLEERAKLVLHLLESMEPSEPFDWERELRLECEQRLAEFDRGETAADDADEVHERLRRSLE